MKRNDINALHTMTVEDLRKKLTELSQAFAKAKLEKKVGKLANRRFAATLSDDIARVKTILTEKEMEASL